MSVGVLKPRWGQPLTGIISFVVFLAIALVTWYIFSDPTRAGRLVSVSLRYVSGDDDFGRNLATYVSC